MKKLIATICTAFMLAVVAAAPMVSMAAPTYAEWYNAKFGEYPDGTVRDWEGDPVYWGYLQQYDKAEYDRLNKELNGGNSDADPAYITDAYWSGSTAKWTVEGPASKYEVKLYRGNTKIKSASSTKKSYSFSGDFPKDGDYWFKVRAYGKYTKKWSEWVESEEKTFKKSASSDPLPVTPGGNGGSPSNPNSSAWSNRWHGSGETWQVVNAQGNGYIANAWWMDPSTSQWYLIGCTGVPGRETFMSAGLFRDSLGNWYLLNPLHDGTYGRMLSGDQNGYYVLNVNGQSIPIYFNKNHDGTYGRIISDVGPVYTALGGAFQLGYVPPTMP